MFEQREESENVLGIYIGMSLTPNLQAHALLLVCVEIHEAGEVHIEARREQRPVSEGRD
jgi:hypothetical protein